jgi:soluble lytic murein transglycosylase-like protein
MTSTDIQNLIVSTASAYGVDPRLALEVASVESGFNPNAVSSAGAVGVFQLMPATAAQYGVSDPTDPTENITAGVQYLAALIAQFGDTSEALGAYNWGPTNVNNAIAQYGNAWLNFAPAETQNYVSTIMQAIGEYTVSAGTTATAAAAPTPTVAPVPIPDFTTGVTEAGFAPTTLSAAAIALLVGAGIFLIWLMAE